MGFFWGLDIVKTSGVAFVYVIHVMRILYAEHGDFCGCSIGCTLEAVKCGFYVRGTKIFAFCKRMCPKRTKIWWDINVENFALKNAYTVSRTWIGYK